MSKGVVLLLMMTEAYMVLMLFYDIGDVTAPPPPKLELFLLALSSILESFLETLLAFRLLTALCVFMIS